MKFLIIGGSGLIGSTISEILGDSDVVSTYSSRELMSKQKNIRVNITDRNQVFEVIKRVNPKVIFHCAAMTDVDLCEIEKELAWNVNVEGTRNVCDVARECKIKLVYFSSDYIFDGNNGPYSEDDDSNPINYYGKTKYEAEKIVKTLGDYLIIRTTVVYGKSEGKKESFVDWILKKLKSDEEIEVLAGQYGNPTLSIDLVNMTLELIKRGRVGIFNVAGDSWLNRYEFAKLVAKIFKYDENMIKSLDIDKLKQIAKRPNFGGLKLDKIKKIGLNPLSAEDSLKVLKNG